ncbi:MAG: hemolysin family protein [Proteobacteria bacterium]|nr:hemolysin family protein [Pseudomonadota bacterium]
MTEDPGGRSPRSNGADPQLSKFKSLRQLWGRFTRSRNGESSVRDTLEELIEERADAEIPINEEERILIANILKLRERTIADVMVPRADIVALDISTTMTDLVGLMTQEGHSRIPIYRETLDDAVGMIHIKDVMAAQGRGGDVILGDIVRDVLFVAPSMQVSELLLEMRVKRSHMALVVDEFGGVDGLLTIEDLVEEIVGEIEDEHDQEEVPFLTPRNDGSVIADARVLVEEFEELVGSILSEEEREEVDTLGGLIVTMAGRVPIRGELIKHPSGIEFEILDADPRRIKILRVLGITPPAAEPQAS